MSSAISNAISNPVAFGKEFAYLMATAVAANWVADQIKTDFIHQYLPAASKYADLIVDSAKDAIKYTAFSYAG